MLSSIYYHLSSQAQGIFERGEKKKFPKCTLNRQLKALISRSDENFLIRAMFRRDDVKYMSKPYTWDCTREKAYKILFSFRFILTMLSSPHILNAIERHFDAPISLVYLNIFFTSLCRVCVCDTHPLSIYHILFLFSRIFGSCHTVKSENEQSTFIHSVQESIFLVSRCVLCTTNAHNTINWLSGYKENVYLFILLFNFCFRKIVTLSRSTRSARNVGHHFAMIFRSTLHF